MHPFFERASGLTETIIAAAIEVHRDKGPGLIESIYKWCLMKELELRGLNCVSQQTVLIEYKDFNKSKQREQRWKMKISVFSVSSCSIPFVRLEEANQ